MIEVFLCQPFELRKQYRNIIFPFKRIQPDILSVMVHKHNIIKATINRVLRCAPNILYKLIQGV